MITAPREMAADEDKPNRERKKVWMDEIYIFCPFRRRWRCFFFFTVVVVVGRWLVEGGPRVDEFMLRSGGGVFVRCKFQAEN